jgi:hypothetical protein
VAVVAQPVVQGAYASGLEPPLVVSGWWYHNRLVVIVPHCSSQQPDEQGR